MVGRVRVLSSFAFFAEGKQVSIGQTHFRSQRFSGLEVVESPRLAQLAGQRLASEVHRAALRRMAHAYRNLCAAVRRAENKYEAATTLLGSERPFGQVRLLWQIFGLQEEGR